MHYQNDATRHMNPFTWKNCFISNFLSFIPSFITKGNNLQTEVYRPQFDTSKKLKYKP